jgi:signal transduction histidine kinase
MHYFRAASDVPEQFDGRLTGGGGGAKRLGQAMQREQSLATDASHQLRTPMAGLRLVIESELAAPRPDPTLALNECLAVTDRLETTVNDLLRLVRQPARSERLDVPGLFEKLRGHWHGSLARAGWRLELDAPRDDLPATWASNAAIEQALDVLIDNALRHGSGSVRIAADRVDGGIALACTDEGIQPTKPARSPTEWALGSTWRRPWWRLRAGGSSGHRSANRARSSSCWQR